MLKRSFLLLLLMLFSAISADAGIKHYRSGVIVAAEVTKAKLAIANLPPLAFPDLPPEHAYAVVSVKLDDMRELSIFDYSLDIQGTPWRCVALYRNNRYEYFPGDMHGTGVMQMVFVVDSKLIPASGMVNAVLKSNLSDARFGYDTPVQCKIIGNKMPTAPRAIPAAGLL